MLGGTSCAALYRWMRVHHAVHPYIWTLGHHGQRSILEADYRATELNFEAFRPTKHYCFASKCCCLLGPLEIQVQQARFCFQMVSQWGILQGFSNHVRADLLKTQGLNSSKQWVEAPTSSMGALRHSVPWHRDTDTTWFSLHMKHIGMAKEVVPSYHLRFHPKELRIITFILAMTSVSFF